ncbi:hypothetical protein [Kitasatospora kifunensis]|uniref:Uncharacterized protein n=1 Tax=Kitasatospora kifunensis TaxID=58351 RepID=A0A7W7W0V7_KITKI|nr:hypothetical protein [Kitasatospora kifunensis]MBB4929055.1 hypothetical protein [Kitasatospora kifunensis]
MLHDLLTAVHEHSSILADNAPTNAPFNPGTGAAPPGFDKLQTIVGWVAWGVTLACVVGILVSAGKMALNHRRGEAGEHATGLAWVLGASILVGVASSIVGMMA